MLKVQCELFEIPHKYYEIAQKALKVHKSKIM